MGWWVRGLLVCVLCVRVCLCVSGVWGAATRADSVWQLALLVTVLVLPVLRLRLCVLGMLHGPCCRGRCAEGCWGYPWLCTAVVVCFLALPDWQRRLACLINGSGYGSGEALPGLGLQYLQVHAHHVHTHTHTHTIAPTTHTYPRGLQCCNLPCRDTRALLRG